MSPPANTRLRVVRCVSSLAGMYPRLFVLSQAGSRALHDRMGAGSDGDDCHRQRQIELRNLHQHRASAAGSIGLSQFRPTASSGSQPTLAVGDELNRCGQHLKIDPLLACILNFFGAGGHLGGSAGTVNHVSLARPVSGRGNRFQGNVPATDDCDGPLGRAAIGITVPCAEELLQNAGFLQLPALECPAQRPHDEKARTLFGPGFESLTAKAAAKPSTVVA
jgi:hypothetical protein